MRVAFFSSHIDKSMQWLWFQEELKVHGIEQIHVFIDEKEPLLSRDLGRIGIKAYYFQHKNHFSHLRNIVRAIKVLHKFKPDIIHTTLPYGNLIGLTAGWILGMKNRISTCENTSWAFDFKSKKQELIDKWSFRLSKKIVTASDSAKEYLLDKWGLHEEELELIYHGVKSEDFQNIQESRCNKIRTEFQIGPNDQIIGMISRLEHWKGHKYAISAMPIVLEKHPNAKLLIFGSGGPEKQNIHKQIEDLGLSNSVRYCGFCDDPIALYSVFDIHLHIPIDKYVETHGITILEGMMSSSPQILTRSGYAFQSAIDRKNCLVSEFQDHTSVAKNILELLEDKELGEFIGKNAKADALSQYSVKSKTLKHLLLYKKLIENG